MTGTVEHETDNGLSSLQPLRFEINSCPVAGCPHENLILKSSFTGTPPIRVEI